MSGMDPRFPADHPENVSARPIGAGDTPDPLPSVLLDPSGVAGWVLRPGDLDRLPVLSTEPRTAPAERSSDPLDAYRTPDGQVGPDTHVTLSYRELRALVALHLMTCAQTMPRERGWVYAESRARAMSDGEVPLLLREVLD